MQNWNLLNKLGKRRKMQGFLNILLLFYNKLNNFNNTVAGMFNSIYHDIKMTLKSHFSHENVKTTIMYATLL